MPDPTRSPAVTRIYHLRALDKLGYDAIADRLNLDAAAYPPPEPTRARAALGRWSGSAVREILQNPKYTGYQVWNRRATKKGGKNNAPKEWIWSPQPTHEPLITREIFDMVAAMARQRQGSRSGADRNRHPAAKRSYTLRSYVYCDLCGRRMFGKSRHKISYYACQPDDRYHRDESWFRAHPKGLWIREEILLEHVANFFALRVFGPDRRTYLEPGLSAASRTTEREVHAEQRAKIERAIADLQEKQSRLIQSLATGGDPTAPDSDPDAERAFRDAIRHEHAALGKQAQVLSRQLTELRTESAPTTPSPCNAALLDCLPQIDIDLATLSEQTQRRLYDAFGLEIRYHRHREELTLRVSLAASLLDELVSVTRELDPGNKKSGTRTEVLAPDHGTRDGQSGKTRHIRSHVLGAPGRIRTCAHGSGGGKRQSSGRWPGRRLALLSYLLSTHSPRSPIWLLQRTVGSLPRHAGNPLASRDPGADHV
ncbi:recombinase family protein [Streptomyces boninensis]|uniref:recombinase family protein n=1 Tax=Streptomyces boninensis TaxID=2039455 RepID=UPI003B222228